MSEIVKRNPPFRLLRAYAFDPITSLDLETSDINEITYKVPWEDVGPGPEGEYIIVFDRDPGSDAIYAPVNLNDPHILAADGLTPSEADPQFHQQMVYAVIMSTIKTFEKALGRKVIWSALEIMAGRFGKTTYEYVDKLLVFPHGMRDQNAYYSPERKALVFGYYNARPKNDGIFLPGGIVYSCLSFDIIAHETTHALLDATYSRYMEVTNPDTAGFHEGFSDIVALFQHFSHTEILQNQIRKVRGNLDAENLLAKLAVEFGKSTGEYSSLRDAIGTSINGKWERQKPDTRDYTTLLECHDRGGLLVSAVFDAFTAVYKQRTADLLRIATGGSGVLPAGELHPDLVNRLANEASKTASHILTMCIRALDYCPPVDLNYGDYLRALITADTELVGEDPWNYRVAFINAFRKRGIFPQGLSNLSVDTLCYNKLDNKEARTYFNEKTVEFLRAFKEKLSYETNRKRIFDVTAEFIRGTKKQKGLHDVLFNHEGAAENAYELENLTGLVFSDSYASLGIKTSRTYKKGPSVEIHSLRLHSRVSPDGNFQNQVIMTLAQRASVTVKHHGTGNKLTFEPVTDGKPKADNRNNMTLRGGCTLIFDLDTLTLSHVVSKPIFDTCHAKEGKKRKLTLNRERLEMQYKCMHGSLRGQLGFAPENEEITEPFACIHKPKNNSL